jgi:hypothetical protein
VIKSRPSQARKSRGESCDHAERQRSRTMSDPAQRCRPGPGSAEIPTQLRELIKRCRNAGSENLFKYLQDLACTTGRARRAGRPAGRRPAAHSPGPATAGSALRLVYAPVSARVSVDENTLRYGSSASASASAATRQVGNDSIGTPAVHHIVAALPVPRDPYTSDVHCDAASGREPARVPNAHVGGGAAHG